MFVEVFRSKGNESDLGAGLPVPDRLSHALATVALVEGHHAVSREAQHVVAQRAHGDLAGALAGAVDFTVSTKHGTAELAAAFRYTADRVFVRGDVEPARKTMATSSEPAASIVRSKPLAIDSTAAKTSTTAATPTTATAIWLQN